MEAYRLETSLTIETSQDGDSENVLFTMMVSQRLIPPSVRLLWRHGEGIRELLEWKTLRSERLGYLIQRVY